MVHDSEILPHPHRFRCLWLTCIQVLQLQQTPVHWNKFFMENFVVVFLCISVFDTVSLYVR